MASTLDDEDLALSISSSHTRRGSTRGSDHAYEPPKESHTRERRDTPTTIRTKQRLGQYQILDTLGEGSFGKVKLAVHTGSGQKVALKIISRRKLMARDMAGRIEREIQYLQLLRHPHIIKLYTVITTSTDIIMVLEYAGSELFEYIVKHGKMQEDKARTFFQQMVCAVEYCHRHKIVHRDLKPENLLLDDNLHVKIADFGLSNIMTDGNFLKTSCGSPNYAAPEVISGKLYAGPEVDVWSCGVILYVLLVGRLPFDDDYIPALFKKIAQGQYHEPHYLSPGAKRLIKRMLQISPVQRITVQEIRNDPWFEKNLPDYLQPAVEEFWDTGVDANKAIDPRALAPGKPAKIQDEIHGSVVEKLGKTMGYRQEDVTKALAKDEPNAIKDAYLIVRENHLMKTTPSLNNEPALHGFLAASPPTGSNLPGSPSVNPSYGGRLMQQNLAHEGTTSRPRPDAPRMGSSTTGSSIGEVRSPVSTIGVLPSSLPDYHKAFMKGGPKPNSHTTHPDDLSKDPTKVQTMEENASAARRLKPHNRSQANLQKLNEPERMTPLEPSQKRARPTKWQFGIRSRNPPAEAMLAIYKALSAMGADWEVPRVRKPGRGHDNGDDNMEQDNGSGSDTFSGSEDDHEDSESETQESYNQGNRSTASTGSSNDGRGRRGERYNRSNDWGYLVPEDPWVINARFRKDGMFPPGVMHPSSAHGSRVDLTEGHDARRRGSTASSVGSAAGHSPNVTENQEHSGPASNAIAAERNLNGESRNGSISGQSSNGFPDADESVYVYMTIQLYSIEKEFYLVDFKCAGYEKLAKVLVKEIQGEGDLEELKRRVEEGTLEQGPSKEVFYEPIGDGTDFKEDEVREELIGEGRAQEEKDASSPFPFLDVASKLIIQLAEAD